MGLVGYVTVKVDHGPYGYDVGCGYQVDPDEGPMLMYFDFDCDLTQDEEAKLRANPCFREKVREALLATLEGVAVAREEAEKEGI